MTASGKQIAGEVIHHTLVVPLRLGDVFEEIVKTLGVALGLRQQPLVVPGHHDSRVTPGI